MEYSRAWYEERARNLGREFLLEVDLAIEKVRESPATFPLLDQQQNVRRFLVHRFPYGVIYRISHHAIQVIAVMHLRRHPNYWRGRISQFEE